jgi:hypothetical protein
MYSFFSRIPPLSCTVFLFLALLFFCLHLLLSLLWQTLICFSALRCPKISFWHAPLGGRQGWPTPPLARRAGSRIRTASFRGCSVTRSTARSLSCASATSRRGTRSRTTRSTRSRTLLSLHFIPIPIFSPRSLPPTARRTADGVNAGRANMLDGGYPPSLIRARHGLSTRKIEVSGRTAAGIVVSTLSRRFSPHLIFPRLAAALVS